MIDTSTLNQVLTVDRKRKMTGQPVSTVDPLEELETALNSIGWTLQEGLQAGFTSYDDFISKVTLNGYEHAVDLYTSLTPTQFASHSFKEDSELTIMPCWQPETGDTSITFAYSLRTDAANLYGKYGTCKYFPSMRINLPFPAISNPPMDYWNLENAVFSATAYVNLTGFNTSKIINADKATYSPASGAKFLNWTVNETFDMRNGTFTVAPSIQGGTWGDIHMPSVVKPASGNPLIQNASTGKVSFTGCGITSVSSSANFMLAFDGSVETSCRLWHKNDGSLANGFSDNRDLSSFDFANYKPMFSIHLLQGAYFNVTVPTSTAGQSYGFNVMGYLASSIPSNNSYRVLTGIQDANAVDLLYMAYVIDGTKKLRYAAMNVNSYNDSEMTQSTLTNIFCNYAGTSMTNMYNENNQAYTWTGIPAYIRPVAAVDGSLQIGDPGSDPDTEYVLMSVQITLDREIVFDGVPAQHTASGEYGLYDRISKTFYSTLAGTVEGTTYSNSGTQPYSYFVGNDSAMYMPFGTSAGKVRFPDSSNMICGNYAAQSGNGLTYSLMKHILPDHHYVYSQDTPFSSVKIYDFIGGNHFDDDGTLHSSTDAHGNQRYWMHIYADAGDFYAIGADSSLHVFDILVTDTAGNHACLRDGSTAAVSTYIEPAGSDWISNDHPLDLTDGSITVSAPPFVWQCSNNATSSKQSNSTIVDVKTGLVTQPIDFINMSPRHLQPSVNALSGGPFASFKDFNYGFLYPSIDEIQYTYALRSVVTQNYVKYLRMPLAWHNLMTSNLTTAELAQLEVDSMRLSGYAGRPVVLEVWNKKYSSMGISMDDASINATDASMYAHTKAYASTDGIEYENCYLNFRFMNNTYPSTTMLLRDIADNIGKDASITTKTLDLSTWDTSVLTNVEYGFSGISGVDTIDLSGCDFSKVQAWDYAFQACKAKTINFTGCAFNGGFSCEGMFDAGSLENGTLERILFSPSAEWTPASTSQDNMKNMFRYQGCLQSIDVLIEGASCYGPYPYKDAFTNDVSLETIRIKHWNSTTANVIDLRHSTRISNASLHYLIANANTNGQKTLVLYDTAKYTSWMAEYPGDSTTMTSKNIQVAVAN